MNKLLGLGDNVVDIFLDRGKMYPGGNALNVSVYAKMQGMETAYLGFFGNDDPGRYNQEVLEKFNIDLSRCRRMEGENGFAKVRTEDGERVILGSNKGGALKDQHWNFSEEDYHYMEEFAVIHSSLNSYLEDELEEIKKHARILSYDFSNRFTDEYLKKICPHCDVAFLSLGHLKDEQAVETLRKVQNFGSWMAVGTLGERGSLVCVEDHIYKIGSVRTEIRDTMGAGDAYLSALLVYLFLKNDYSSNITSGILDAMEYAALYAAGICKLEGAFGYGKEMKELP